MSAVFTGNGNGVRSILTNGTDYLRSLTGLDTPYGVKSVVNPAGDFLTLEDGQLEFLLINAHSGVSNGTITATVDGDGYAYGYSLGGGNSFIFISNDTNYDVPPVRFSTLNININRGTDNITVYYRYRVN